MFQGEYRVFFLSEAKNESLAKTLFLEFTDFLKNIEKTHGKCGLYCYSGTDFDFRVLENLLIKYDCLTKDYKELRKQDLFHLLVKAVILPITSYKLKDVAKFLDCPQKSEEDYDGLAACLDYYSVFRPNSNATEEEKKSMKQKLLTYNEEDLRKVVYIWNKLFSK